MKIKEREDRIKRIFTNVRKFYEQGGDSLYLEDKELYIRYMDYLRKKDSECINIKHEIEKMEEEIEEIRKNREKL